MQPLMVNFQEVKSRVLTGAGGRQSHTCSRSLSLAPALGRLVRKGWGAPYIVASFGMRHH